NPLHSSHFIVIISKITYIISYIGFVCNYFRRDQMRQSLTPFMILFAAMLWGTAETAKDFAREDNRISMGVASFVIDYARLMAIAVFTKKMTFKGWPVKPLIIGGIAMALFQPFFFSAVELTGIAVGTVVSIGSAPVFSGMIEWLVFKIRPSRVWWLSTFLAI